MGNSSGVAPELTVEIERTTLRAIKLKNLIEEQVTSDQRVNAPSPRSYDI